MRDEQREHRRILELVRELRGRGWSLRQIGAELERRGTLTKTGRGTWNPKVVAGLLKKRAA